MEHNSRTKRTYVVALIVISGILGVIFGWITYVFELVVKAMLGLSFYYFMLRGSFFSKKETSLEDILSRSNHLRTIVEIFVISALTVWSYFCITDLLLTIIRFIVF